MTTSEGYIKTLFHITGDQDKPWFKPKRQPIMMVSGAGGNAWGYVNGSRWNPTAWRFKKDTLEQLKKMIDEGHPELKSTLW